MVLLCLYVLELISTSCYISFILPEWESYCSEISCHFTVKPSTLLSLKKGNLFWAWKDDSVGKICYVNMSTWVWISSTSLGPAACIHISVISALRRWTQVESWNSLTSQLGKNNDPQVQGRDPGPKMEWRTIEEETGCLPIASKFMFKHMGM